MEVRRFEALSMQDAIKLVKKELGKDAVILSTREKATQHADSATPIRVVEVMAARASSSGEEVKNVTKFNFPRLQKDSDVTVVKGSPTLSQLNPQTRLAAQSLAASMPLQSATAAAKEETQNDMQNLRVEIARVRKEIENIPHMNMNDQMQEIKVLLHDLMRTKQKSDITGQHEFLNDIAIKMRAAGVQEVLIGQVINTVKNIPVPKNPDGADINSGKLQEFYLNQTLIFIFKHFSITGPWKNNGRQNIVALVGPSGVGKTTTIAKLAATLKLTENQKVALVSMDNFRIAAADQLRVYSKILNCPFAEASDTAELEAFVQKNFDCGTIFIDTAGRNSRQEGQMEGLRRLQMSSLPIHFHLAISSTMKQRDIDETIKVFRFLNPESLLFTKLDESWSFGEILSSTIQSKIPLSYFTTGQKVPEDIEIASKERVVERIFRL